MEASYTLIYASSKASSTTSSPYDIWLWMSIAEASTKYSSSTLDFSIVFFSTSFVANTKVWAPRCMSDDTLKETNMISRVFLFGKEIRFIFLFSFNFFSLNPNFKLTTLNKHGKRLKPSQRPTVNGSYISSLHFTGTFSSSSQLITLRWITVLPSLKKKRYL